MDIAGRVVQEQLQHMPLGTCLRLQPLAAQLVELGQGLVGKVPEMQAGALELSRGPPAGLQLPILV